MIEWTRTDAELFLIEHHTCGHLDRRKRVGLGAVAASKQCALHQLAAVQLMRQDGEIRLVVLDEIPGVRMQLVTHLLDEIRWPVHAHASVTAEAYAKQMIEPSKMIHVRM